MSSHALPRIAAFAKRRTMRAAALAVLAVAATLAWERTALAQSVWQLTPYQVRILLALGAAPELSGSLERSLGEQLIQRAEATVGAPWDLSIAPAPPRLRAQALADLESLTLDQVPADALDAEKVIVVAVRPVGGRYELAARELDVRTQTWNSVISRPVVQFAKIGPAVLAVAIEAFAPLARVEDVQDDRVKLRLRASALPTRDSELQLVKPGDAFVPVIRQNDREGKIRSIRRVAWTYLTVEEISPRDVDCRMDSGMRNPIAARRSGRVEQLALAVVPSDRSTRLVLKARSDPEQVLAGYDVFVLGPDGKPSFRLGRTDRSGSIRIDPGDTRVRVLLIRNGEELLARIPVVPGSPPVVETPVPGDDRRLEAEGFVAGLQEELVDLVTRRQILLTRAETYLEEGKLDAAGKLVEEILALKDRNDFAELIDQKKKGIYTEDRAVQAKIDALFADTQKLLERHLDPAPVDELVRRLRAARAGTSTARSG